MYPASTPQVIQHHGGLIDLILSAVLSLHQRHPLRLGVPTAAGDAVKVYAPRNSGARDVGTIPYGLVASCSLHLIHLVVDGPYRVVRQLNLTKR